jgi:hypothetical protein
MGLVGIVLKFDRLDESEGKIAEVLIDVGGGEEITPAHFAPAGIDSQPLPDDLAVTSETPGDDGQTVVGYADITNEGKAEPGEVRLYARDASGATVCEIHLKADKSLRMENEEGFFELGADGQVNINNNFTVDK